MKRSEISQEQFEEWRRTTWHEYASQTLKSGERLCWRVNFYGAFLVTLDEKVLYRGFSFGPAKDAWDKA